MPCLTNQIRAQFLSVAPGENVSIRVAGLREPLYIFAITLVVTFEFGECEIVGLQRKII